jgi:hypothetical protein
MAKKTKATGKAGKAAVAVRDVPSRKHRAAGTAKHRAGRKRGGGRR